MNHSTWYIARGVLLLSGLLAMGIAASILLAPQAFYAGYGIELEGNVNLANELKAGTGVLFAAGALMLAGAFRRDRVEQSLALATTVYLGYGVSRLFSIGLDGVPDGGLVGAAALEVALGAVALLLFRRYRRHAGGPA